MNDRIKNLKILLKEKSHHQYRKDSLRISILESQNREKPFVIRKALALNKALSEMPVFLQDGELIAGGRTVYTLPEYVLPEEIQNGVQYREDSGYDDVFNIHYNLGQDERGFARPNGDPPNYHKLLELGIPGIIEIAQNKLKNTTDENKRNYYQAVLIAYDGLKTLIKRYATLAREKVKDASSPNAAAELYKISQVCENIINNKPADFWQALQLVYFAHVTCWVEDSYLVPVGRFDQFMFPFYKNDVLAKKTFSRDEIKELIECFFIKLNFEIDKTHGKGGKIESDTGQTVVIGGIDPSTKKSAVNDLTYMVIDCCADLKITDPKIHIRFNNKSPEQLWQKATQLASLGMGFPTFHNDEAIFKALGKTGKGYYTKEDIYDYAIAGCWEIIIPGKTSFRQCCNFDLLGPLEWVLNNGFGFVDVPRIAKGPFDDGKRWGLYVGSLEEFKSFDDLMDAYKKELRFAIMMNAYHIIAAKITFMPFLSSLVDDCLEKGADLNEGGARYNEADMQCCSLANATDSLYIIKKIVFDEKRYDLPTFISIVKNNYAAHEDLREEILKKYAHFGNDVDEVDQIAKEVAGCFADEYCRYTNGLNGPFRARISGAGSSVYLTKTLGASPDGRKQGDFLASNASPQPGVAKQGPTAVINSLAKLDLAKFAGGTMLNLKFSPKIISNQKGLDSLGNLIKTYFKLGGLQMQLNIVSSDILREAQRKPQEYEDLIVRVWGFSTYFVSLPKGYQDQLINELEHSVS